ISNLSFTGERISGVRYAKRRAAKTAELKTKNFTKEETMLKRLGTAVLAAATLAAISPSAQAQTPINVSYQPALYWALPYYVATEKNWWKDVGLKPNFSVFPAGAPHR